MDSQGSEKGQFRRQIGPIGLFCISVSSVLGSAWLFAALFAAQIAGPAAILSWIFASGGALLLALVFAELGAAFPVAGGLARFAFFSHGTLVGFASAIACWLAYVCIAPIEVQAVIRYLADDLPWLLQPGTAHELSARGVAVAAALLLFFSVVNGIGIAWMSRLNIILTCWKLVVPVVVPIALLGVSFRAENFTEFGGWMPFGWNGVFSAISTGGALFAFLGFRTAVELAAESRNPQRDIPFALIGAVAVTTLIYLLIQVAFIGALSPADLAGGWKNLHSQVTAGPFVGLAMAAGLAWLAKLLLVDAVISPGACGLVFTGATARLLFAMGKNGQIPRAFTALNGAGVPALAIGLNFLIGLLFFMPSQTWQSLVNLISSIMILSLAFGPPALVALEHSAAEVPRPFRVPAGRVLIPLSFIIANCMIYWGGWQTNALCLGVLAGLLILFTAWKQAKGALTRKDYEGLYWVAPYLAGLALVSAFGQFGGRHSLSGGLDYLLLTGLSLGVLAAARHWGVDPRACRKRLEAGKNL